MAPATAAMQVFVAVPSAAAGRRIAAALLDARLCACVQLLGPMTSFYTWKGRRESAREHLVVVKTRAALYARLEAAVRDLHPYAVPEILALPVTRGSASYLAWLRRETRAAHRRS